MNRDGIANVSGFFLIVKTISSEENKSGNQRQELTGYNLRKKTVYIPCVATFSRSLNFDQGALLQVPHL